MRLVLFSYKLNCFHLLSLSHMVTNTFLIVLPKNDKESKESKYFLKDLSPFHFNHSLVTSQHCILMINHSDKKQAKKQK